MNANSLFKAGLIAAQQPSWPDAAAVKSAVAELESFPPLVFAGECDNLKKRIAQAAKPLFQLCTWRRSAKPPCVKARTRFNVAAEVL